MEQIPDFEYGANNGRLSPASEFYERHGFFHDEDEYDPYDNNDFEYSSSVELHDGRLSPASEFYQRHGFYHDEDEDDPYDNNEFEYSSSVELHDYDGRLSPASEFYHRHGYFHSDDENDPWDEMLSITSHYYEWELEEEREERYRMELRRQRFDRERQLAHRHQNNMFNIINRPSCVYPEPRDVQMNSNGWTLVTKNNSMFASGPSIYVQMRSRLLAVKKKKMKKKKASKNGYRYAAQEACDRSKRFIPIERKYCKDTAELNEDIAVNWSLAGNVIEKNIAIVPPAAQDFSLDFSFGFNNETVIVQLQELQRN